MNTTPDSRIRDDWTLPAETAAPPPTLDAIDTSTTAGRIAVMRAWDRGEDIEVAVRSPGCPWRKAYGGVNNIPNGDWDWKAYDYRIAPPPVARTALQLARERTMAVLADEAAAGDVQLAVLVREVDSSPLVIISMRTVGFGDEATPYPTIVQLVDGDPKSMQPGRYRLLRDDA